METYTFLRAFADSWMLLVLFLFFCGVFLWVIRPGSNAKHDDAKTIPLRYEDRPGPARADTAPHKGANKEART